MHFFYEKSKKSLAFCPKVHYNAPGNTPKTEHQPHTTMAKYTVTHACGHDHTYQLYGPNRERERKIAWLAEQDCPECAKRAREEQHKAEAEEAAKVTEGMDLPELTGTPKQVAWANTIRGQFIALLQKEEGVRMDVALIIIRLYTSASWWIDNRSVDFGALTNLKIMFDARKDEVLAILKGNIAEKPAQEPAEAPKDPENDKPTAQAQKAPQKPVWRKIALNKQNIEHTTATGALIKMTHSSEHDGFKFWVSAKLLREGRHSYELFLSVKDDMEFKLQKRGGWSSNNKLLDERTISADQLAEAFGGYVEDAPRYTSQAKIANDEETIEHHVPAPLAPVEIDADPELAR